MARHRRRSAGCCTSSGYGASRTVGAGGAGRHLASASAGSGRPTELGAAGSPTSTSWRWSSAPTRAAIRLPVGPGLPGRRPSPMTASSPRRRSGPSPWRALAPCDGELLWDVGAGAGSVAIEWLRAGRGHAGGRDRARAGTGRAHRAPTPSSSACPSWSVRKGEAPAGLDGLPSTGRGLRRRRRWPIPGLLDALLGPAAARRPTGRQRRHPCR